MPVAGQTPDHRIDRRFPRRFAAAVGQVDEDRRRFRQVFLDILERRKKTGAPEALEFQSFLRQRIVIRIFLDRMDRDVALDDRQLVIPNAAAIPRSSARKSGSSSVVLPLVSTASTISMLFFLARLGR